MKENYFKKIVIAIDGPSASGKSTTARLVAKELGYLHLDTGAMYRAITYFILENKIDIKNIKNLNNILNDVQIKLLQVDNNLQVLLNGKNISDEIRTPLVTSNVSSISSIAEVRTLMVKEQQLIGKDGGIVCEGRDIGTVVFPNAELKIFMVASDIARAKRRLKDFSEQGFEEDVIKIADEIKKRDNLDSSREISPLKKADDAIEIDTTELTIEEQVKYIVEKAKEKINACNN
ncbi:MAG: (d)CMP kinase [Bacteroidota bacterium]